MTVNHPDTKHTHCKRQISIYHPHERAKNRADLRVATSSERKKIDVLGDNTCAGSYVCSEESFQSDNKILFTVVVDKRNNMSFVCSISPNV